MFSNFPVKSLPIEGNGARSLAVLVVYLAFTSLMFATGSRGAQFPPVIDLADTTADVTILGAADLDRTGIGLTSGDYDGDGLNDFALLSSGDRSSAFIDIFWGRSPLDSTIDLLTYHGDFSKVVAPAGAVGYLSARITSGDFNGDGYDDLVLGLPEAAPAVYIIFGSASFPDTLELGNPVSPVTTVLATAGSAGRLGTALAAGDVNGDGYTDLVIGAPADSPGGGVDVIYGRLSFPPTIQLGQTQPGLTRIIEPYPYQETGNGVACKDVNKDGFDDLLIGSPGNWVYSEGLVTLLFGSDALPETIVLWDSTVKAMGMKRFWGEYSHGYLGWRVGIGDLEGDGVEDLVLSACVADPLGCDNCGEIYVISWSPALPDSVNVGSTTVPMKRLIGSGKMQLYGEELAVADVTGDGRDDVLVISRPDQGVPSDVGKVTVVYGSSSLPDSLFLGTDPLVTRFLAEGRQDDFGRGLGVGDVNNDGITDVLIGAEGALPLGRFIAGEAYVFYATDGLTGIRARLSPTLTLSQNYPNPFNPVTRIDYSVPSRGRVTLEVYDVAGQRVVRLVDKEQTPGPYAVEWDGRDEDGIRVSSGVYFYRLTVGRQALTKKMVLLQ